MLSQLTISNIVLIEQADLPFEEGLCVLSGETGAGKSILLDALGLVLGGRADAGLIRKAIRIDVITAAPERKVRYLNSRKKASWSVWVSSDR